ncbi:MAG: uracil-DNA glycosylase [Duganella sp.]
MSVSPRNAVFLDEMGIGALWKLRQPGPAFEQTEQTEQSDRAEPASVAVGQAAVADRRPASGPRPAPETLSAPLPETLPERLAERPPASRAESLPESAPGMAVGLVAALAPELAADAAATPAPAPGRLAAAVTERMSAPAPVSAPAPAPATPTFTARATTPAPADDDSMAWFDDVPAAPRAPAVPRAQPQPVSDAAIAAMDWPELQAAVSSCTRCPLSLTRRNAVNGRGPERASWFAIIAGPTRQDEADIVPATGEAGQLLDNMLRAIAVKPEADVYVTGLVKCRPATDDGADRAPTADELTACRPYLHRELALAGATMAMTFGQLAARGLMMGPAARGKVMRYGAGNLPVVATYHPDDLLLRPQDKAKAWGDLCLARTAPARD